MQKTNQSESNKNKELVFSRLLAVPPEEAWRAWTEPESVKSWWGPRNFTTPVAKIDLRPGGGYLYAMRSAEGQETWSKGMFREVVPLKRLVVIDSFSDSKGNTVPASYYGLSASFPLEAQIVITFDEAAGGTQLTVRYSDITGIEGKDLQDMRQGWQETLNRLAEYVESDKKSKTPPEQNTADFNAYLRFNGNCREAMQFYQRCLGGQMNMMTVGQSPSAAQMPADQQDKILHSILTSGKIMLMGTDIGEGEYLHGNTLSLCLVCKTREEIERYFSNLSEGARVTHPLKEEFFGTYGQLIDKYGFAWMFQFGVMQSAK